MENLCLLMNLMKNILHPNNNIKIAINLIGRNIMKTNMLFIILLLYMIFLSGCNSTKQYRKDINKHKFTN